VGTAESGVSHDQDGLFRLEANYQIKLGGGLATAEVANRYVVTIDGEMRRVVSKVTLRPAVPIDLVEAIIEGPIRDGAFHATGSLRFQETRYPVTFDPLPVSGQAAMINPQHPVNRINDLWPGRTWQIQMFDPISLVRTAKIQGKAPPLLETVLSGARNLADSKPVIMRAQVLPETQSLIWDGGRHDCFIIDYQSDDDSLQIWVRTSDGLVLQQVARHRDTRLLMLRRSHRDTMGRPTPGGLPTGKWPPPGTPPPLDHRSPDFRLIPPDSGRPPQ
jgi:hypothetical protein